MTVIKLGGSLMAAHTLLDCLSTIASRYQHTPTVIVPGGGDFANQVRLAQKQWQFNNSIAHQMAILAMQQMALLLKGLNHSFIIADSIADIQQTIAQHQIPIWSPNIVELDQADIPHSWDITSDSLSAWLAQQLIATELILIKSVAIDPELSITELTEQNIVDSAFDAFTQHASFNITLIHANRF